MLDSIAGNLLAFKAPLFIKRLALGWSGEIKLAQFASSLRGLTL